MSQKMIDAFIKKCGSLEEWGGDQSAWHEAMGFFFQGYLASQEAVEHTHAPAGKPSGHHGSSLECTHPFCVAEREQAAAGND